MVHPFHDVDVCVTIIHDKAPRLPLREELHSLGAETIYKVRGRGTVTLAAKHIRAKKIREQQQRKQRITEYRRQQIKDNRDDSHQTIKKSWDDEDCNTLREIPSVEKCHSLNGVTYTEMNKHADLGKKSQISFAEGTEGGNTEIIKPKLKGILKRRSVVKDTAVRESRIESATAHKFEIEKNELQETEVEDVEIPKIEAKYAEIREAEVEDTEVSGAHVVDNEVKGAHVEEVRVKKVDIEDAKVKEGNAEDDEVESQETEIDDTRVQETEVESAEVECAEVEEAEVEDTEEVQEAEIEDAGIQETEIEDTGIQETEIEDAGIQETEYDVVWEEEIEDDAVRESRSLEATFRETKTVDRRVEETKVGDTVGRKATAKETQVHDYKHTSDDWTEAERYEQAARSRISTRKTVDAIAKGKAINEHYMYELSEGEPWEREIKQARCEVRSLQWAETRSSELDRARMEVENRRQMMRKKTSKTQTAIKSVKQRNLSRNANNLSRYQQAGRQPKETVDWAKRLDYAHSESTDRGKKPSTSTNSNVPVLDSRDNKRHSNEFAHARSKELACMKEGSRNAKEKDMFTIDWAEELSKTRKAGSNEWVQRYTVQENSGKLHSKWVDEAMQQGEHLFERSKSREASC